MRCLRTCQCRVRRGGVHVPCSCDVLRWLCRRLARQSACSFIWRFPFKTLCSALSGARLPLPCVLDKCGWLWNNCEAAQIPTIAWYATSMHVRRAATMQYGPGGHIDMC